MMDNNTILPINQSSSAARKPLREDYWLQHITVQNKSKLSKAEYCRKHNLVVHQYYYGEQKLNARAINLIPVKLEQPIKSEQPICSMVFKNGIQLKIHDASILPMLISAVG